MSDNELDNLFKEAADGFKAPVDSSAWKDMSSRLDKAGVGTSVFWNWKTISAITAVGIIVSSSVIWYASQKDVDQSIAKDTSSSEQVESNTLKLNQAAQEKTTEPNSATAQDEQSTLSSDTHENQKNVFGDKPVRAITEASKPTESSGVTREPVNPSHQGGGDLSKITQRTESKAVPSNASTNKASVGATSQQKVNKDESQRPETVAVTAVDVGSKGSAVGEGQADASAYNKVSVPEASERKVIVDESQQAGTVIIPTGAAAVKRSPAPETKIAPSNATSVDGKASSVETSQQNLTADENKRAGAVLIPASVVASESNVSKAEKQNVSGDEKQISNSETEFSDSKKSSTESKSSNQVTSNSPLATDSLVKPVEDLPIVTEHADADSKKSDTKEENTKSATALSVKVAVAPDFSSINYFSADGSGFNFGALVGYSFNNRWSVYTGAILSRKIYSSTEIDEPYTTSGGYPYEVNELEGDCRVIDIPINVYYTFFPEKSFSIKAGLGFTSYLMLSEEYTYHIDNPYGYDVYHQKIEHENNEWFKMLNVSMIVQKKLSSRFSLELEPFLKAPLAGVGEGEVSLVSLGAFLNLRFDIPIIKQKGNGE